VEITYVYSVPQLRIDTPEQVALELPVAGIGSRFLAIAIDTILQVALALVVILVVTVSGLGLRPLARLTASWQSFAPALIILAIFCIYWGYFAVFEIAWRGQTPGKRAAKIRVIRDTGRPIDAWAAIIRNLLRAIDIIPGVYGVGLIAMILNRHSRRLGDFAAGTVVVHDRRPDELVAPWSPSTPAAAAHPDAARLTDAEVVLIETYLARRLDYDPAAGQAAAEQIVARIARLTGLAPDPGQSLDEFLEQTAAQARNAGRYGR
jgi:uncharacterized RDD family membrane protein YckC